MKKRAISGLFTLFFLALLLFEMPFPAALAADQRVFDQAGLLTQDQATALEEQCTQLRDSLQLDVAVVTTNDAGGKTAEAYADDFYDAGGYGVGDSKDGVLFLIDMDNREAYISTCGAAVPLLSDKAIQGILDQVIPCLQQQDYDGAAKAFFTGMTAEIQSVQNQQSAQSQPFAQSQQPAESMEPQETAYDVRDDADVFLSSAHRRLKNRVEQLSQELKIGVFLVVVDGTGGKSMAQYAEDCYRQNNYGVGVEKSGTLFLLDTRTNDAYLYVTADAGQYLTEENIPDILDDAAGRFENGNYESGLNAFLEDLEEAGENFRETGSPIPPPPLSDPDYIVGALGLALLGLRSWAAVSASGSCTGATIPASRRPGTPIIEWAA